MENYSVKTLALMCKFSEEENGLIRDHIVLGIGDSGLKRHLLRESGLELENLTEIVYGAEKSTEHGK